MSGVSMVLWMHSYLAHARTHTVEHSCCRKMPVLQRMRKVMVERGGFLALYRGIWPGTMRSFLSNGTSMVVMVWAQRKVSEWGLRGDK